MWTMMALVATPEAAACGGFGCSLTVPVLQNAERVVFSVDPQGDGTDVVEMHVQITYEGEADEFAWIVPVPSDPELFVTSSALFGQLQVATAPRFTLASVDEGVCLDDIGVFSSDFALSASGGTRGVSVVGQEAVGPYETVTLQATSVEALLTWLEINSYELPDGSEKAIAPYIAEEGAYFVALRLQKDKDAGDLTPLGLRYTASKAMIPVQLTAVSATPDMRMEVYIFGATRAVPETYFHVQINEAALDWWNFGQNYFDVLTQAADEAGGHAFATDYYGDSSVAGPFFVAADFSETLVRGSGSPEIWIDRAMQGMVTTPGELVDVVQDQLGLSGDDAEEFVSCRGGCVSGAAFVNGVDAATDDLMERVIDPLLAAQRLVDDHPKLTRMTSSLDAVEMTVDPVFVLNPDMVDTDVSFNHTATLVTKCGVGGRRDHAERRLELANGLAIELPSRRWFERNGTTEMEYIADLGERKALIIEETGATGLPSVLSDYTSELQTLTDRLNRLGCGCDSGTATGSIASLLAAIALAGMRRRRG